MLRGYLSFQVGPRCLQFLHLHSFRLHNLHLRSHRHHSPGHRSHSRSTDHSPGIFKNITSNFSQRTESLYTNRQNGSSVTLFISDCCSKGHWFYVSTKSLEIIVFSKKKWHLKLELLKGHQKMWIWIKMCYWSCLSVVFPRSRHGFLVLIFTVLVLVVITGRICSSLVSYSFLVAITA